MQDYAWPVVQGSGDRPMAAVAAHTDRQWGENQVVRFGEAAA